MCAFQCVGAAALQGMSSMDPSAQNAAYAATIQLLELKVPVCMCVPVFVYVCLYLCVCVCLCVLCNLCII
jgi:hypothetical protein